MSILEGSHVYQFLTLVSYNSKIYLRCHALFDCLFSYTRPKVKQILEIAVFVKGGISLIDLLLSSDCSNVFFCCRRLAVNSERIVKSIAKIINFIVKPI